MTTRENCLNQIIEKMTQLRYFITANRYDDNALIEEFYAGLLNLIYGWDLMAGNKDREDHQGFDLVDEKHKIIVRMSTSNTSATIRHTIEACKKNPKDLSDYLLLILFVLGKKNQYLYDFNTEGLLIFDKARDIWDDQTILSALKNESAEMLLKVLDYLNHELSVLDKSVENTNDIYTFGKYVDNGIQLPLQWKRLAVDGDKILLISVKAIAKVPYHNVYQKCTWEKSAIRHWLNNAFLTEAFTKDEIERIIPVKIDTAESGITYDSVFLLSADEYSKYLSSEEGIHRDIKTNIAGFGWMRDTRTDSPRAFGVHPDGTIRFNGYTVNNRDGLVRPALWIKNDDIKKAEEFTEDFEINYPIEIVNTDLTQIDADVLVDSTSTNCNYNRGISRSIYYAAKGIEASIEWPEKCDVSEVIMTPGYSLNASYIMHTVGPTWRNYGQAESERLLDLTYRNVLECAKENDFHKIAIPLISSGGKHFPIKIAWDIALKACLTFLKNNPDYDIRIIFSDYSRAKIQEGQRLLDSMKITEGIAYTYYRMLKKGSEQALSYINHKKENPYVSGLLNGNLSHLYIWDDTKREYICRYTKEKQYHMEILTLLMHQISESATFVEKKRNKTEDPLIAKINSPSEDREGIDAIPVTEMPEEEETEKIKNVEKVNSWWKEYPFEKQEMPAFDHLIELKTTDGDSLISTILSKISKDVNLFLIGEYGSGKTIATYQIVKALRENIDRSKIWPLWLALRHSQFDEKKYTVYEAAERFVDSEIAKHRFVESDITENGKRSILAILDGFDEIYSGLYDSEKKVEFLEAVIHVLRHKYRNTTVNILVSSRDVDYQAAKASSMDESVLQSFEYITIAMPDREEVANNSDNESSIKLEESLPYGSLMRRPVYYGIMLQLSAEEKENIENEVSLIKRFIEKSIPYQEPGYRTIQNWACSITTNMSNGEGMDYVTDEIENGIHPDGYKSIVDIHRNESGSYRIRFVHNVIREYLVAQYVFSQLKDCSQGSSLKYLSAAMLTPEIITFFLQILNKERDIIQEKYVDQLVEILCQTKEKPDIYLGYNILSILCKHPMFCNGKYRDLTGIRADNLYLWNCKLHNVCFENAVMHNLKLFNVELTQIDFTNADLSGLVVGTNAKILDMKCRLENRALYIYVMYANGEIAHCYCPDVAKVKHYQLQKVSEYSDLSYERLLPLPLKEDIMLYSEKKVRFLDDNGEFLLQDDFSIKEITDQMVVMAYQGQLNRGIPQRYYIQNRDIIPKGSVKKGVNICFLETNEYVLNMSDCLKFYKDNKEYDSIKLDCVPDCFTAYKGENDLIYIFSKQGKMMELWLYHMDTKEIRRLREINLDHYSDFKKMFALSESLLYAVSDQSAYVFQLDGKELETGNIKLKVRCKNILLDGVRDAQALSTLTELCKATH